jgi:hypothetical protein
MICRWRETHAPTRWNAPSSEVNEKELLVPIMRAGPADAMLMTSPSTTPPAYSLRHCSVCVGENRTLSLPPATKTAAASAPGVRRRGSKCCACACTATTLSLSVTGCEAKEEQLRVYVPGTRQDPAYAAHRERAYSRRPW